MFDYEIINDKRLFKKFYLIKYPLSKNVFDKLHYLIKLKRNKLSELNNLNHIN